MKGIYLGVLELRFSPLEGVDAEGILLEMAQYLAVVVLTLGLYGVSVNSAPDAEADPLLNAHSPFYYTFFQPTPMQQPKLEDQTPACAKNSTKLWCLEDPDYPGAEIQHALHQHYHGVRFLHSDVIPTPENSIQGSKTQDEEYLCSSETSYAWPLRAVNAEGKWRVIVNKLEVYGENLTQSVRMEECIGSPGGPCPLMPPCYETACVQKFIFHRFIVFDPYDFIFPFAVESFKFPSSCSCSLTLPLSL